jgi:hypothetical protein
LTAHSALHLCATRPPCRRGKCDDALIACTNKNSLFKLQARYIVDRCDAELWDKVLSTENTFRRQLIDQVVSTALPESKNPEQVGGKPQAQAGSGAELNEGWGEVSGILLLVNWFQSLILLAGGWSGVCHWGI